MIKFTKGDMFESGASILVNPVNCHGVMGGGLAKVFKDKYPHVFSDYKSLCRRGRMSPGYPELVNISKKKKVKCLLFPTKDHWKDPSKRSWIETGLVNFIRHVRQYEADFDDYQSIAFPALGCGLGGLNWKEVKLIMQFYCNQLEPYIDDIYIYEPK